MIKDSCSEVAQLRAMPNMIESSNDGGYEMEQTASHNLWKKLFEYPYGQPGNACERLLRTVAELLIKDGVPDIYIKSGLLVFLVMISAKINRPVSMILQAQDDPAEADHLISACERLIPNGTVQKLSGLSRDDLYSAGDHFQNKVLVCRDFTSIKTIAADLQNLIVNGRINVHARAKTKFGVHMTEFMVSGPVSFVGIESENETKFFDHPCFLRVQLSSGHWDWKGSTAPVVASAGIEFEKARIIDYLASFQKKKSMIPYEGQLSSAILKQRPIHFHHKNKTITRLLSICTILNNPPTPNVAKFLAKSFNSHEDRVYEWLKGQQVFMEEKLPSEGPLVSTEVEYRLVKSLLDGVIPIQERRPSALRCELFEIVKSINSEMFKSSTIKNNDVLEMLYGLNNSQFYWAKIGIIFKKFNSGRPDIVPVQKIANELMAMKKLGIIEKRKINRLLKNSFSSCDF